jgi:hypothetical protein
MDSFRYHKVRRIAVRMLSLLIVALSLLFSACSISHPQLQPSQPAKNPPINPSRTPISSLTPSPSASGLPRSDFERGMIYPRWHQDSYGTADTTWQHGIQTIKMQTGATWLEIPVLFSQATPYSTNVGSGPNTPSPDAFANGIHTAHALGYRVFFIPLLGVNIPGGWSGIVQFNTQQQEQVWFDSYWNTLKPYAAVAQNNGVEQMAIGTELDWLQQYAPASLWNELIARARSVFKGILTYDANWWPSLYRPPQSWMKNPDLAIIGISEYISLVDASVWVDPKVMPDLWRNKVGKLIDAFSSQVGKQVLISEIGYRNSSDVLYNPWNPQSTAPVDQEAQAAAYAATLSNVFGDSKIAGVFFWGWDDVGRLAIKGQLAVQVVHKWYTKHH